MQKIPTLFARNPEDRRYVLPEVTPGCAWVLAGEGVATRKYDGICVMLNEDGVWWARREVKQGKPRPPLWYSINFDPTTGKHVGWEPITNSSFYKFFAEVMEGFWVDRDDLTPGTYELIGPKINGNPERVDHHMLIRHADADVLSEFLIADTKERDFATIRATLQVYAAQHFEGIVWHHPDGRMTKLKVRDFPPKESS